MLGKEGLGFGADFVRQQGDPAKVFFSGKLNGVPEQPAAVTHAAVLGMDNDVFHQNNQATFSRADGKQEIHHADDRVVRAQDKNAAAIGLFEDQAQTVFLFVSVRTEVSLFTEERPQQLNELGHVFNGGRFNVRLGSQDRHRGQCSEGHANRKQVMPGSVHSAKGGRGH